MATIAENLVKLQTAKTNIKTVIENEGEDLSNIPFTQYADKILEMQSKKSETIKAYQDELEKILNGTYELKST